MQVGRTFDSVNIICRDTRVHNMSRILKISIFKLYRHSCMLPGYKICIVGEFTSGLKLTPRQTQRGLFALASYSSTQQSPNTCGFPQIINFPSLRDSKSGRNEIFSDMFTNCRVDCNFKVENRKSTSNKKMHSLFCE